MPETRPNPLEEAIRAEIERDGSIPFDRFMELALYAPGLGYYVRGRDPFGAAGDFYTAEQIQPVFGILVSQWVASVLDRARDPESFQVVELGAGRGEMADALSPFRYTPVDAERGSLPERVDGVIFANEFFDALPVSVAVRRAGEFREVRVTYRDGRLRFIEAGPPGERALDYLNRYYAAAENGSTIELHLRALEWMDRIARALRGYLLIIDYGYTAREWIRYSEGTLMSYHRHTAIEDVLADPGNRDITAHVPFTVLEKHAQALGLRTERLETLASFLLRVGEQDQFGAALAANSEKESMRRRMQLKTLIYGMGETFRVLLAKSDTQ